MVAEYEPEWDPTAADAFTVWARFESPEFQGLLREWLFHAVRSQGESLSEQTGVRITQVFLEAFWWWGFYLRSPVCEQLLREFDIISADKSEADRQWLGDLSTFYRNFRWGYVYNWPGQEQRTGPKSARPWPGCAVTPASTPGKTMDKARHSINVITLVYRVRPPRSAIRAAIRTWRPACSRTRGPPCGAASTRATSATSGGTPGSSTSPPTCGSPAAGWPRPARPCTSRPARSRPRRQDLFDRDLVNRAASLQGEVYLARGDYGAAIDCCARAALLVYAYHVSQETDKQPPNEYTYARHGECIASAEAILATVRDTIPARGAPGSCVCA